jgi:hypothetical protein
MPSVPGPKHLPVVDLLEGLAVTLVASHLADDQHHRRGVLERGVQPDAGVGGARPARDHAHARPAAELALGFGHEGRPTLLPAGDEADAFAVLVEAVQYGEVALARHTEHGVDALGDQCFDQQVAGNVVKSSTGLCGTSAPALLTPGRPCAGPPPAPRRRTAAAPAPRRTSVAAYQPRSMNAPKISGEMAKPTSSPEYTVP